VAQGVKPALLAATQHPSAKSCGLLLLSFRESGNTWLRFGVANGKKKTMDFRGMTSLHGFPFSRE
jgi:hypothetical protein